MKKASKNGKQRSKYAIIGLKVTDNETPKKPLIRILPTGDSVVFGCLLFNYGNSEAFNFKIKTVFVYIHKGVIKSYNSNDDIYGAANRSVVIYPLKDQGFLKKYEYNTKNNDSTFVAILVNYSDSTSKAKHFQKILYYNRTLDDFFEINPNDEKI